MCLAFGMRSNTLFIYSSPHKGCGQSWANQLLPPSSTFVLDVGTATQAVVKGCQATVLPLAKLTGASGNNRSIAVQER